MAEHPGEIPLGGAITVAVRVGMTVRELDGGAAELKTSHPLTPKAVDVANDRVRWRSVWSSTAFGSGAGAG
jgi:hypothetical protein